MLVDTGAAYSLLPYSYADPQFILPSDRKSLSSIGTGSISVFGKIKRQIDLGFSQLFEHTFYVVELDYGILGADFLCHFNLNVDMSTKRLFCLPEVERCCLSQDDSPQMFSPTSYSLSETSILANLERDFPEVFEPLKRSRFVKHSIESKNRDTH